MIVQYTQDWLFFDSCHLVPGLGLLHAILLRKSLTGGQYMSKIHQVPWMLQAREVDEMSVVAFSIHLHWAGMKHIRITEI